MNYIPLLFLILLLKNSKSSSLKSILSSIDLDSLKPILEMCGLSDSVTQFISSDEFENLLEGNLDLKSLLPLVMPLMSKFSKQNKSGGATETPPTDCHFLQPIENLADEKIKTNLKILLT